VAYPIPLTAKLSGATVDQLAYWRRPTSSQPALLVPDAKKGGRYLYSWQDVIALRSIVFLRQVKSLPRIRKAVNVLRSIGPDEWQHLAQYRLAATGTSIVVMTPDGTLLDVDEHAGTIMEEVLMEDVFQGFRREDGTPVPALERPHKNISVNPRVLGGYPVIAGTRVPYDVVASLTEDGYSEGDIIELYPSIQPGFVAGVDQFAQDVENAA
jgi:uncharacterized protein (DUF433 family)/DNA-binding transcriptional MerR regulator